MRIINLTQHVATAEQEAAGVFAPRVRQAKLLDFETAPSATELRDRAVKVVRAARLSKASHALIGGAPYFMGYVERELRSHGIVPLYSFSQRVSVESASADGNVTKTSVFKHVAFVEGESK